MEPDLDQARRRAKELLRAARAGDPGALARMRDDRAPRLADAQRAVAADLGFPSWPAMVAEAHAPRGLQAVLLAGDAEGLAAALRDDPGLVSRELPEGRKPLSFACHVALRSAERPAGVRRAIELLLDAGADPNETFDNEYGAMPVLYGAAGVAHDLETTRLLLDRGANPDDGESVYHSLEADDTACLELLLARGATVRDTNALGNAIAMGSARKARILLEQGDLTPADPELRDSLLHARDPEVAALLIEHGADVDARDESGRTPYSHAARFKSDATMRLLEAAGASTELDPAAAWVGAVVRGEAERAARIRAEHPEMALRWQDAEELPRWASAGDDEVVARLLDAGVPIDARGVDEGTPLHYAGMWGRASTVELLLARGADVHAMGGPREFPGQPLAWTAWGSRELHGAAERVDGYLGAVEALLAAGARVWQGMLEVAADEVAVRLEEAAERSGVVRSTGLAYAPLRPVGISVRRRERRIDIDDMGAAVAFAGRRPGWREAAERAVEPLGWNVTREGVVCMQAVEGRDVDDLVRRTAEASLAVRDALLDLED